MAEFLNPVYGFWLTIYAITVTVGAAPCRPALGAPAHAQALSMGHAYTEYIDVSEFSNRNIPLRVTYKGTEPRWLWATYMALRNSGRQDMHGRGHARAPALHRRRAAGCRYIGFNRLRATRPRSRSRRCSRATTCTARSSSTAWARAMRFCPRCFSSPMSRKE